MDLAFSPEEKQFQADVRNFLLEKLTPELKRAHAGGPKAAYLAAKSAFFDRLAE